MIGKILASSKQSTFLPNFRGVYSNKNLYGRYGPTGETTSTFFFVEEMKNFFLKFQSTFTFETFSMILILIGINIQRVGRVRPRKYVLGVRYIHQHVGYSIIVRVIII